MLLDTSGLLCLFDRKHSHYTASQNYFRDSPIRITHNYVIDEFISLCQARRYSRTDALKFISDYPNDDTIVFFWVDERRHMAALTLLEQRLDKTYSLCDAVSFILMRRFGIAEALTTDRHFEQEGFMRLLRPIS